MERLAKMSKEKQVQHQHNLAHQHSMTHHRKEFLSFAAADTFVMRNSIPPHPELFTLEMKKVAEVQGQARAEHPAHHGNHSARGLFGNQEMDGGGGNGEDGDVTQSESDGEKGARR